MPPALMSSASTPSRRRIVGEPIPSIDMVSYAIYYGDDWPDFLPQAWLDEWQHGRSTNLSQVVEAFARGFETTAAHMLADMFAGAGVDLVFEHFPDEVQVFDPETDRRASRAHRPAAPADQGHTQEPPPPQRCPTCDGDGFAGVCPDSTVEPIWNVCRTCGGRGTL